MGSKGWEVSIAVSAGLGNVPFPLPEKKRGPITTVNKCSRANDRVPSLHAYLVFFFFFPHDHFQVQTILSLDVL